MSTGWTAVIADRLAAGLQHAAGRIGALVLVTLFVVALFANLYAAAFFLLAPHLDLAQVFLVLAGISLVPIAVVLLSMRARAGRRREEPAADMQALQLAAAFEAGRFATRNWPLLLAGAAALAFVRRRD